MKVFDDFTITNKKKQEKEQLVKDKAARDFEGVPTTLFID